MKTFIWLLITVFFHFCTLTPASAFTIGEERELGEKLLYSVRSAFSLVDEPDITQYITKLGQSVLEVAGIQYFDYRFYVIDNKEFNAFAAPSGLIFFNSGLIATMESEDELVSVLAHEVGHIVKRHIAARMEKSKYSSIGSVGMALAALAFGGAATPALLTGALATGQSFNLHFSRLHEEEADLLAYDWMKELHRDPEGQVKMLESMRRIARYRSEKPPQYLLTHPNPEERLNYIESLVYIDKGDYKVTRKPDDNFEFLRFKYRILTKTKQSTDVKAYLASIIADSRSSEFKKVMAYYGLSQLAKNENDIANGFAFLEKVITHFPKENILNVDKATLEFAGGEFEEAERTLRKVLVKDNSDMYATMTLAKLLYRTGRISEAQKYFQTVSYELPEYPTVYFELGQIASDQKEGGVSSYYLGKYYLYQGRLKQAEQHFKNALRSDTLPEKMKAEIKELFKQIKRLRE
ncbi:MAG: M48 family metalloprotease [Desulfobulbaceae bacterium]|nr:M48 family metalloprotease [Desulfobulbaceae bacterium]